MFKIFYTFFIAVNIIFFNCFAFGQDFSSSQPVVNQTIKMGINDIFERVRHYEPLIRERAYQKMRAEIDLRRAKWNRINGGIGVQANETGAIAGFGTLPAQSQSTTQIFDRFTANLNAEINFPFFAGGAITSAIQAADARQKVADHQMKISERDFKRLAFIAYATLVANNQQIDIAKRALERAQQLLEIGEKAKSSGIRSEVDVVRIKMNLLSKQEDFLLRKTDRLLSLNTLRAALSLNENIEIEPTDSLETLAQFSPSLSQPYSRLEFALAYHQLQAAQADRKIQVANYWPRLELFGRFLYGNSVTPANTPLNIDQATQRFGVLSGSVFAGIRLNWNAFDFLVTRDNVSRADAEVKAAQARLDDQQRLITKEKVEALTKETLAKNRLSTLSGGQDVAQRSVKLTRASYEAGNALITDVLNAEIDAINIESRLLQAAYDLANAHIDRLRAEGHTL